jgi:hypothetical protein
MAAATDVGDDLATGLSALALADGPAPAPAGAAPAPPSAAAAAAAAAATPAARPAAAEHPFETDPGDHAETPFEAYAHLDLLLSRLAK